MIVNVSAGCQIVTSSIIESKSRKSSLLMQLKERKPRESKKRDLSKFGEHEAAVPYLPKRERKINEKVHWME